MIDLVLARIQAQCPNVSRLPAASACKWLKGVFAPTVDAVRSGVAEGPLARRFSIGDFTPRLRACWRLSAARRKIDELAAPVLAVALLIAAAVMASPLQCGLAEFLPPWGAAAVAGGYATMDTHQGETRLLDTSDGVSTRFLARVGVQGELHLESTYKRRACRRLRLHCTNCEAEDGSLAPEVPLASGMAVVRYRVVDIHVPANLSVELLSAEGSQLATATIELEVEGKEIP